MLSQKPAQQIAKKTRGEFIGSIELAECVNIRRTPSGRIVGDVYIETQHTNANGKLVKVGVPSIVWENNTSKLKSFTPDDSVSIRGRIQSRTYNREEGGRTRMYEVYEVSIADIDRV